MAVNDDAARRGGSKRTARTDPWRRRRRLQTVVLAPLLTASIALLVVSAMLATVTTQDRRARDEATEQLGATGALPRQQHPDPRLLAEAAHPRTLAQDDRYVDGPPGRLDVPEPVLRAYMDAADSLAEKRPDCGLHWSVLASIGRVESGHARAGDVDANGSTTSAILGPRLDGSDGVAAVPDTDSGELDGDSEWDRAVGPMQFLPDTWRKIVGDDDQADPHNVRDATMATGQYLCEQGRDLHDPQELARAVFAYNHSTEYVREVLIWAHAYRRGVAPTPTELAPPREHDVLAGQRFPQRQPMDTPELDLPQHPLPEPPPPAENDDDGLGLNTEPPVPPADERPPQDEPQPQHANGEVVPSDPGAGPDDAGQDVPTTERPATSSSTDAPGNSANDPTDTETPPGAGAPADAETSVAAPSSSDPQEEDPAGNTTTEMGVGWPFAQEEPANLDGILGGVSSGSGDGPNPGDRPGRD